MNWAQHHALHLQGAQVLQMLLQTCEEEKDELNSEAREASGLLILSTTFPLPQRGLDHETKQLTQGASHITSETGLNWLRRPVVQGGESGGAESATLRKQ